MNDSLTLFERNYPILKECNLLKFYNTTNKQFNPTSYSSGKAFQPLNKCRSITNESIRLSDARFKIDNHLSDFKQTVETSLKGLFYIDYKSEGRDWTNFCLQLNQSYRKYRRDVSDSLDMFKVTYVKNIAALIKDLIDANINTSLATLDEVFEANFAKILAQSRFEVDKIRLDRFIQPLYESLQYAMNPSKVIENSTDEINRVEDYIRSKREELESTFDRIKKRIDTYKETSKIKPIHISLLPAVNVQTEPNSKFYHSKLFAAKLFTFTEHSANELITDFDVWNNLIISVSGDRSIRVTEPSSGIEHACTVRAHEGIISCMTLLPGDVVATGGKDGLIHLFSIKTFRKIDTLHINKDWVRQLLRYSVDQIVSCSDDSSVVFYNYHLKQVVNRINTTDRSAVTRMVLMPDQSAMYFGGCHLYKYCLKTKMIKHTFEVVHSGRYIRALAVYSGHILLSGGENGTIRGYDTVSNENLFNIFLREEIYSFCILRSNYLVVSTEKNKLVIVDVDEQRKVEEIKTEVFSYKLIETQGGILYAKYNQILMLKLN